LRTKTRPGRPGLREQGLGLFAVSHPLPSAAYVLAVAMVSWLAATAAHRPLHPWKLTVLLLAIACSQIATGAANDIQDLELDRASRREKPLVRGAITVRQASSVAWLATAGVVLFALPLGLVPLMLCLLIEVLGLAYDFGLKGTPLSAVLFAVFFPLLPIVAWVVFGRWEPYLPWLVPVLALLGVAMNIANSLPDLENDRASGVRGFPHVLGKRKSLVLAWCLPALALALIWLLDLFGTVPASPPGLLLASVAGLAAIGVAALLTLRRPTDQTLRAAFVIQALGVLGIGGGWLTAVAL
jgi:4-hydroxybenzoate polyprenyltransferase